MEKIKQTTLEQIKEIAELLQCPELISKHKKTTDETLEQAKTLLETIEEKLRIDLFDFESIEFGCSVFQDNGLSCGDFCYSKWTAYRALIYYKSGKLVIKAYRPDTPFQDDTDKLVEKIMDFDKINFRQFFLAVIDFLQKYNDFSERKENQIDDFMLKSQIIIDALTK